MKCTLLLLTLLLPLSLVAQTNVQKVQGTNVISNGSIVVGNSTSLSATGTGSITATAFSGTLPVANGGTGVTSSSGANSVVLRDSNANVSANNFYAGFINQAASGTTLILTAASAPNAVITGSGGQIIKLPDATTLTNGTKYTFNNNQSSGTITIQNNSSTTVCTTQSGAFIEVVLLSNSTAAGTWDYHNVAPSNASWSTNTLSWAGSYTSGTWNGSAISALYGGTGTTGLTGYVYGNGTSAMTASTTIPSTALSGTITNAQLANSAITIAGTSTSLGGSINQDAITGLSATGLIKRTGANTLAIATSGTDYLPSTGGTGVTTLGTIATGVWNGTSIAVANGGTGSTTAASAQRALTPATSTISASAIDWSLSNSFYKALTANTTLTFSNAQDGQVITITLLNTTSNYTVTWPTIKWAGGTAPTMTTGAHYDVYTIYYNSTAGAYFGSYVQNF